MHKTSLTLVLATAGIVFGVWLPSNSNAKETSSTTNAATHVIEKTFDAGSSDNDILYECILGGKEVKTIKAIEYSCGCTSADLSVGQVLSFDKPFKIAIHTNGKPPGKGVQTLTIGFEDGTKIISRIEFLYQPIPFASPRYLVFKKGESNINVSFFFPGEQGVQLKKMQHPKSIVHSEPQKGDPANNELIVRFSCNRDQATDRTGVIDVETTSKRSPKFGIPFILLVN
jgi:hypothetical protein